MCDTHACDCVTIVLGDICSLLFSSSFSGLDACSDDFVDCYDYMDYGSNYDECDEDDY